MTDETKVEEITPKPEMTQEQLMIVRNHILQLAQSKYNELMTILKSQPIFQQAFMQSFLFLDTGMLWAKEAIYFAPFVQQSPLSPSSETTPDPLSDVN